MPAHKDTKHPAGQIVNQDKEQGSLSNYIRSIRRAQALDDVAAEKRLTFEEWYAKRYTEVDDPTFIHDAREIWKAAQENK